MTIENELDRFFSKDRDASCVVEDHDKFKMKLQIGSEAFTLLTKVDNLGRFTRALGAGGVASATVYTGFISSLGVMGHIGLAIGLVSTPVGWMVAAGAGGAAATFGIQELFKTVKEESVTEVPKFINSPIDVLGASVLNIFMPILLKIAHADGNFSAEERSFIEPYFVKEWGFNELYIWQLVGAMVANLHTFQYKDLATMLKKIEETGDIKYATSAREILRIAEDLIQIDGVIHAKEILEFERLKAALACPGGAAAERWQRPDISPPPDISGP